MPSATNYGRVRIGAAGTIHSLSFNRQPKKTSKPLPPTPNFMRDTVHKICSILRTLPWDSAREELGLFPIRWDSFTVNRVLKTHPPMEKAWLFFNWASHLPGFKHDHFTYTTMLDIFGEAGRIASMRQVLGEMMDKGLRIDAVTYTSVMHWLAKDGDFDGAVAAWEEMQQNRDCVLTVVSYTAFMKVLFDYGRPQEAADVYKEMMEKGMKPNCRTYTVLMEHLIGVGLFKQALEILSEMQEAGVQPDKATCNSLVHKCSLARHTSSITHILRYMKANSIVLRRPVFLDALEAFKSSGESDLLLRELHPHLDEEMVEPELARDNPNSIIDRSIIDNFLARRNFVALEQLLHEMIHKETQFDSEVLTVIVIANCENHRLSGALAAFRCSVEAGQKLDRSAYLSLIGLLLRDKSYDMVLEVVEAMIHIGMGLGTYLLSLLIYRLGCAGFSGVLMKIFSVLPDEHNASTYTALMNALFQAGDVEKSMEIYTRMRDEGVRVCHGTYDVLIAGLEGAGRVRDADVFRKAKRSLNGQDFSKLTFSTDEILCNRFFGSPLF